MKKEWKKKASFEYRIPNIFCTFKLFIGNKYKILLPTPVFIICTSNNGNIYTPNETANTDIDECIRADINNVTLSTNPIPTNCMTTVADEVDPELLAKVLANPEMRALLNSLVKTMK